MARMQGCPIVQCFPDTLGLSLAVAETVDRHLVGHTHDSLTPDSGRMFVVEIHSRSSSGVADSTTLLYS